MATIFFAGFSYENIIDHVVNYIGNTDSEFRTYVRDLVLMSEQRYLKMHDWSFTFRTELTLPITSQYQEYTLDSSTIGYFMQASDIESIRADDSYLQKVDLSELRRLDSGVYINTLPVEPKFWAAIGHNKIYVWPPNVRSQDLLIDGKISPSSTIDSTTQQLSGNPIIPMLYQEGFIEYVKALALDRENDDRAAAKKVEALQLIRLDIQTDMRNIGDTLTPRIKSMFELPGQPLTPAAVAPQPPTNVAISSPVFQPEFGGFYSSILSWTAPSNTGGANITDYVIQYRQTSSPTWVTFTDNISPNTSVPINFSTSPIENFLVAPGSYLFRVAAVNSIGVSEYSSPSNEVNVTVPEPEPEIIFTLSPRISPEFIDVMGSLTLPWTTVSIVDPPQVVNPGSVNSYQWQRRPPFAENFEDIENETFATLTLSWGINFFPSDDFTQYRQVIQIGAQTLISDATTVIITSGPI